MRPISVLILTVLFTTVLLPPILAEDYTRWELPEGAKLRLGKGEIRDLWRGNQYQFFPDGSQFIVFTSIGIWVYDTQTGEEMRLLTGTKESIPISINLRKKLQDFLLLEGFLTPIFCAILSNRG